MFLQLFRGKGFLERYQPELDVERNFSPYGWLFHDENKNTVAILSATLREGMLHVSEPYADVTVFERNGMMLAWIQSDKIITTGDLWFTPKGALEAMPSKFRFPVTIGAMAGSGPRVLDVFWLWKTHCIPRSSKVNDTLWVPCSGL